MAEQDNYDKNLHASAARERRHFLPANSIGYFSPLRQQHVQKGAKGRRRNRAVWVLRRGQTKARQDTPNRVANARDVYHPGMGPHYDVDNYFKVFESMNDEAVTSLLLEQAERKSFNAWIRLAAYVSSRIARNPDAEFRLVQDEDNPWQPEQRGIGYVMAMQRISAAVLRARWAFLISDHEDFIINDRGFTGLLVPPWKSPGLLVPLRKKCAVVLGTGPFPKPTSWTGIDWQIEIPSHSVTDEQMRRYNALSWIGCRDEAYGSSAEALCAARDMHTSVPDQMHSLALADAMFTILGGTIEDHMRDELLLLRLVNGLPDPIDFDPLRLLV
ncbi:hypothetical protein [Arthrobacter woluwensis]|uniref:hypothetical protein n=1 Tax=Arthrobacter woluwensis TaxID=156980 RepID=UPI00382D2CAC